MWYAGDYIPLCQNVSHGEHVVCGVLARGHWVVKGVDVGRWVVEDPIIALTNPTGLCVRWGLRRLWTLRCQKAIRRKEVDTVTVSW